MKLIQAENYPARGVTAFLLRIRWEEANPTFKHPENWDSLSFQEKANLIIANKAVKLMELQCRESVTRHQERENITNSRSGLLDKKPSILGREANTDVAIPLIQATNTSKEDNYRIRHDEHLPDKKPSTLGGEVNTDVAIPLIQVINTSEEDNYRIRHDEHQPYNALPPKFINKASSRVEQDSIDAVEYHE